MCFSDVLLSQRMEVPKGTTISGQALVCAEFQWCACRNRCSLRPREHGLGFVLEGASGAQLLEWGSLLPVLLLTVFPWILGGSQPC